MTGTTTTTPRVDVAPDLDHGRTLAEDALDGLTQPFKTLPARHLYDDRGSELFDRICEQPEYYPTRLERDILTARAGEIAALTGAADLVELGSGFATKTRVLLDALREAGSLRRYVPFDVSALTVRRCAQELSSAYAPAEVHGVVGDFERHLGLIPPPLHGPRLLAFLGGTFGNLPPGSRRHLLRQLRPLLGDDGHLLVGVDLVKDPAIIEPAYDDAAGVSAAFGRNLIDVLNRELDGSLDPEAFEYVAYFDRRHEWVEMRLRALHTHTARLEAIDLQVDFLEREEMRTELSTKFTEARIRRDVAAAGLALDRLLTDEDGWYGLALVRPV